MLKNSVREMRARFRFTQQDLADKIGVSRQTIGLIEKGDYAPSITLALKISSVFGVPVEQIFHLEGEE
ncbi:MULTISPECIES: helix-turn-helix transcriptional regulator [Bacillus]|jgi:putative transcriptional regulator|uniref:Helix-turn-helix transcriptional regulator n=1 Tax=Bacillus infantis TaxID=324767 RepID=A0A5D4RLC7_9BACI|nr:MULTISPECIES: helix-turn-helix transcriptional regulator [Bacillus]MCA1038477.1 helix-turn-helix transcriptional regulator [Bacillus infantis]MCK6205675.1 helix-turn-helix transcriptional regulator [Bacillus infantis]MCP1158857.1 helix-turn-helix transcriptional regulator [Bacillus infantis]MCR6611282.1 helix-turn-helix transcriptional regulator [Bacillus infantis]MDT0162476.1 helix-turn-helix transcriptional regulator [Bacillus sp. AG4(2022)]